MALYYFLFVSESYIWVSETFEGGAWMFIFFAVMLDMGHRRVNILLVLLPSSILIFLAFFSHFLVIIPTFFVLIYLIIEQKNWPFSNKTSFLLICILLMVIGLKFLDTKSDYDTAHLHGVTHFSIKRILTTFQKPVVKIFLYRCLTNYWVGTLVFITSIVMLLKNKERALAMWTVISLLGYFILMGLTYGELDETTLLFHIESEWSFVGIIVATPFVFTVLPGLKPAAAIWIVMGVFAIRLAYIISFLPLFSQRNEMTEQILSQMRKKGIMKLALYNDEGLRKTAILDWGLPFESMLISSMDGEKPQRTFLFVNRDDKQTIAELNNTKDFYHAWTMLPYNDLNKAYFDIDTAKPYQIMTYAEFVK